MVIPREMNFPKTQLLRHIGQRMHLFWVKYGNSREREREKERREKRKERR